GCGAPAVCVCLSRLDREAGASRGGAGCCRLRRSRGTWVGPRAARNAGRRSHYPRADRVPARPGRHGMTGATYPGLTLALSGTGRIGSNFGPERDEGWYVDRTSLNVDKVLDRAW